VTRSLVIAVLFVMASATLVHSQPADFDSFFDKLRDRTVETLRGQIEKIERHRPTRADSDYRRRALRDARLTQVAVRAPSLASANATTAIDLAQAAINTSVDGADAGVTVNPLGLVGHQDDPFRLPITIAALKDGVTRLAIGANLQTTAEPVLELDSCMPTDWTDVKSRIEQTRPAYAATCRAVAAFPAPGSKNFPAPNKGSADFNKACELVTEMRLNCGLAVDTSECGAGLVPADTLSTAIEQLTGETRNLQKIYYPLAEAESKSAAGSVDAKFVAARNAIAEISHTITADHLSDYSEQLPECHDSDDIGAAAMRASWNMTRWRFGASIRADLFQRLFGFNPDPSTPLEDGRLKEGEGRAELSYARRGVELVVGVGYGMSRPELTTDLTGYVSPAVSIAWTAASLSGTPLYDKNCDVNLVDGALPPRLVLGIDAQFQYAPSPPAEQVVNLQKVAVTGFADFRFTEKLTVRIGIPVNAELVSRKADASKGVAAKTDRQWSVPVFAATVIKL
jgi:hypothetical protein